MTYLYADRQVFECANVMCLDLEVKSAGRTSTVAAHLFPVFQQEVA
jgi:hypothetical protein